MVNGGPQDPQGQGAVGDASMDTIGPWELLIIVVVLVALVGANRLPKMARGLGEGIREFKKGVSEASSPTSDTEPAPPAGQQSSRTAEPPSQPAEQPPAPLG